MSPIGATPSLAVTFTSPVSNGRLPVLSFTILLSNSSGVQWSRSPGGKSPSRTTNSILIGWGRLAGAIRPFDLVSTTTIWSGLFSTSVILLPVKMGSESFWLKISLRLDGSRAWMRNEEDLVNERQGLYLLTPRCTSSFTWSYDKVNHESY